MQDVKKLGVDIALGKQMQFQSDTTSSFSAKTLLGLDRIIPCSTGWG